MMDDEQLLRRYAKEQDQDAFAELVRRYLNFVYTAAWRQVRDPQLAEDVAQIVFANLARKAGSISSRTVLAGWLHRDTRYTVLELLRKERRRQARELEHIAMETPHNDPDWVNIRPLLDDALSKLSAGDRDALLLRFFEERSYKEVGDVLGAGEDSARKRVSRALEKLRALLADSGVTTSGAALALTLSAGYVQAAPPALLAAILSSTASTSASAAGGLTVFKFIQMIIMNKTKTTIAGGLLALLIGAPVAWQFQTTRKLRHENSQLKEEVGTLEAKLQNTQGEYSGEIARLRGELGGGGRRRMVLSNGKVIINGEDQLVGGGAGKTVRFRTRSVAGPDGDILTEGLGDGVGSGVPGDASYDVVPTPRATPGAPGVPSRPATPAPEPQ
jgi:RNA polymerase sigma factor (sigma-70 family)